MENSRGKRRAVATAMLAIAFTLLVASSVLSFLPVTSDAPSTWGTRIGGGVWSIALLCFPGVGWLIARRDPANLIGWLMLWVGVAAGLDFACAAYGILASRSELALPLVAAAASVGNWSWIGWIGVVAVFLTHLFPTGRPLSRRWRNWLVILLVFLFCGAIGSALSPGPLDVDPTIRNPFGVESAIVGWLEAGVMALPLGVLTGAVSVVMRYRRGTSLERAQLRWFATAVGVVAIGFCAVMVASAPWFEGSISPLVLAVFQDVVNVLWTGVAIAVGIAILRYRLYAIDLVINRALVYGSLTALLAGAYLVCVLGFQAVLREFTGGGELAVAASTLVVAGMFGPLRRRIQAFIDRRFYRSRYDAQRLLESFAARMRDEIDLDDIATELMSAARASVGPRSASVWLSRPGPRPRSA